MKSLGWGVSVTTILVGSITVVGVTVAGMAVSVTIVGTRSVARFLLVFRPIP